MAMVDRPDAARIDWGDEDEEERPEFDLDHRQPQAV